MRDPDEPYVRRYVAAVCISFPFPQVHTKAMTIFQPSRVAPVSAAVAALAFLCGCATSDDLGLEKVGPEAFLGMRQSHGKHVMTYVGHTRHVAPSHARVFMYQRDWWGSLGHGPAVVKWCWLLEFSKDLQVEILADRNPFSNPMPSDQLNEDVLRLPERTGR